MEPAVQNSLPSLYISQLNPVPNWDLNSNKRTPIAFALRKLPDFSLCGNKEINQWSIKIYRARDKAHEGLDALLDTKIERSSNEERTGSYEYLIFLFKERMDSVFVLSTNKAYKLIRNECSMLFARQCSTILLPLLNRIQQVSTGQVFGPVSDIKMNLHQDYPDIINQSGLIYREISAQGKECKIDFKENGIIFYLNFSLEEYVQIVDILVPSQPVFEWHTPDLATGNLIQVNQKQQQKLNTKICSYLVGLEVPGYTFSLKISNRWYSKATFFRLCTETQTANSLNGAETNIVSLSKCSFPPNLDSVMSIFSETSLTSGSKVRTDFERKGNLDSILEGRAAIEYETTNNQWYGQPLIDSLEGNVRSKSGNVYFKLGQAWYKIKKEYTALVQESFNKVISQPGCLLAKGQPGYLRRYWKKGNETTYNRSYMKYNSEDLPQKWYDGNQKLRTNVEIFDILHIAKNDEVFIYHVKNKFDTHIKEAASQLIISAQLIYNSRNTLLAHPDSKKTKDYCKNVADDSERLFNALRTGKLNFVLAFKSDGADHMLRSASLIAKSEVIRAKEEIEKLGFSFKISPIPTR